MHDPAPSTPPSLPGWLSAAAILLVAAGLAFLAPRISPYAGGADSSGYLNSARLLGRAKAMVTPRLLPGHGAREFGDMVFQPLGFHLEGDGRQMVPTYPIGLPLHLLVAARIAGWHNAAVAVNLLAFTACGILMWMIARHLGLPRVGAAGAVVLLWLCPLFLFATLQPMSDLLAVAWSLAVVYCALQAREHWGWAVACGAALGMAVLVRPTNALLAVPVAVALGTQIRAYLLVGLGSLPGAGAFAAYNWRVYGSPIITGYGDVSQVFGGEFLPHNLAHFARWIPLLLSPLIVVALLAPFLPVFRRRGYAVLATWFVLLTGFYAFYFHSGETWWYLRFILPVFPVLILAALTVLIAIGTAAGWRATTATALTACLVVVAGTWEIVQTRRLAVLPFEQQERSYPDAAHWAQKNLPAKSAIFCMQVSGAFYYYTDFLLVRWDEVDADKSAALFAALAARDQPVYAALFPFESAEALKISGHWTQVATVGQVTFWQRQP